MRRRFRRPGVAIPTAASMAVVGLVAMSLSFANSNTSGAAGTVGEGFVVTQSDLTFILKQIRIAERHARAFEGDPAAATQPNPNPGTDPSYCLSMIGSAVDQVPDPLTSYGLRTVDGQCNNLESVLSSTAQNNSHPTPSYTNHPTIGAADQPFPRLTSPVFKTAEAAPPAFGGGPVTSYGQKLANNVVFDSQPRLISNLIVDQTSTNPAAIAAAGFPVRAQGGGNPTVPCATNADGSDITPLTPAGCVPRYHTLFIENVTTDVGLSPPYNSLFTFFGQFFDHGVDQTVKGFGTVIVPLRADDPLIAGPDHVLGNADDLPPQLRFIPLTRGQNQPGPDGVFGTADDVQDANNTDTPWVDQSQTYTSHASHQVFLRQYDVVGGHPLATGRFLGGLPAGATYAGSPDGTTGMSTWKATKVQAATKLGLLLKDKDVFNIPTLLTDPYGNFVPGPARGLPQYVTANGLVEGDLANPVPVPADVVYFDTPFLTDIAHNAEPQPGLAPDADDVPSADFAAQTPGTYDDEMLDAHFTCGDGRCNENIALSTIHQIFHSEHDRLADEFDGVTLPADQPLMDAFKATNCPIGCATNDPSKPVTFTYGQRLFQAARFVTEMEYQHLVFEEFARKIQPAVRPFHVYSPDINPAVKAEFAHAVYRFGHSMLDDDVARTTVDPATGARSDNSLPLLTAFLNPPEFFDAHGTLGSAAYTPEQAGGAIVMGSSDQSGNELDEFINDTLRNNLLGLPLDLATFNLTRARSEGIPPLNQVRRDIFGQTNDGQLAPYTSWSDFGQHLKHPESLVNFVAAYGTHPSITGAATATAKRDAARAIVNPLPTDVPPADAGDFMFSTGAWSSTSGGVTITGLDSVDLWVGGLAEITNLFGGLLGSTFNYVFQNQLENLQDGDRFYYLARTPGMNLRTQLEGNSFSELIMRNTDGTDTLKADAFATADCKFQLGNLTFPAAAGSFITGAGSVNDDPTTDCNENRLLLRQPNGTIQYRQFNSVNPSGINGQAVYNGTAGDDRMFGGNDNDTFWGGNGKDVIEGNGGDDVALGGAGNDIITDLGGADVPKGGPGNDAIDAGIGDDIPMGGPGQDFINGGANDNESFAGPGNDFVIAGQGADAVFGDGGDDWIQGGSGQDLLQGDHGAPFFDDPGQTAPGNDIFVGQVGENDYDAEGGDDVMAQNSFVDRNAGAGGFDWAIHQYNTIAADDDMNINQMLVGLPIQLVVNRDRWQETEADSGAGFNDVIRGDDLVPTANGGAGFSGCDALDAAGLARIPGLEVLVTPAMLTVDPATLAATSSAGVCPFTGPVWGDGNILLGGGGSDSLEGRGANDILDGDRSLTVRIAVHQTVNADDSGPAGPEIGSTDLMENPAKTGTFGPGTDGMTLQQAVFAGLVDPGQLESARAIGLTGVAPTDVDTAVFSGPVGNYTVSPPQANGSITVTDNVGTDGTDTLFDMEQLSFCATPGAVRGTCAVPRTIVSLAPVTGSASPASLAFGNQLTATTSAPQTVTVTNTGTANLVVSGVAPTGTDAASFAATGCAAATLPAGGTCTVTVTFTPASAGAKVASVTVTTNGSPLVVSVTGTGTTATPVVGVTPASLTFGSQTTGTSSAAQAITVSNAGTGPLAVTGVAVGTDFAQTNTCTTVAPGGTCTINVVFSPVTAGARTGTVTITTNDPATPTKTVAVSGTGVAPAGLTATPAPALTFGPQNVGTNSAIQTITLRNSGAVRITVSSVTVASTPAGAFTITNPGNCTRTIAPAGTCNVNVRFTPTAAGGSGPKTGTVTAVSTSGTTVTSLTGTAVVPAPTMGAVAGVNFGRQARGSTTTVNVQVTNTGGANSAPLVVGAATITGSPAGVFSVNLNTCANPVSAGQSCQLRVTFTPPAGSAVNVTGTLTVTSNASNSPRTATVRGNTR